MSQKTKTKQDTTCPTCSARIVQHNGPGRPRKFCDLACKREWHRRQEAEALRTATLLLAMRAAADVVPED